MDATGSTTPQERARPDGGEQPTAKAPRTGAAHGDRVVLNVGGTRFHTTFSTLASSSSYFAACASGSWRESSADEIFLDRDADVFSALLTMMRAGRPFLPEHDRPLCVRILLEAEFFGMDNLIQQVKDMAHRNMFARDPPGQQTRAEAFDRKYGGIEAALRKGILPDRIFGPPPPKAAAARSFSLRVEGSSIESNYPLSDSTTLEGRIQPGEWEWLEDVEPGDVVYIHSAVLAGVVELRRYAEDKTPAEGGDYATKGTYLACTRCNSHGDFQLQYTSDDGTSDFVLAHRGVDFVQADSESLKDLQFREVLDTMIKVPAGQWCSSDTPFGLRARGLGVWHVHGWIGPANAIPRASAPAASRS